MGATAQTINITLLLKQQYQYLVNMVILFPVQTCDYNYCDEIVNHRQILKCDRTKCEGNHPKLERIKKDPSTKANQYLRYALQNSRDVRFEQEKLQIAQDNIFKQMLRNSSNFHPKNNNSYNSVSNLANYEMELDESIPMEISEELDNPEKESITMEWSEEFHVNEKTELELQQEISTSQYSTLDTNSIKDFFCIAFMNKTTY